MTLINEWTQNRCGKFVLPFISPLLIKWGICECSYKNQDFFSFFNQCVFSLCVYLSEDAVSAVACQEMNRWGITPESCGLKLEGEKCQNSAFLQDKMSQDFPHNFFWNMQEEKGHKLAIMHYAWIYKVLLCHYWGKWRSPGAIELSKFSISRMQL